MRASSKRPRVESSDVAPSPSSSTGDTSTEASVDPAAVPPPSTSDDSDIRRMLETIMTIQATHGQLFGGWA